MHLRSFAALALLTTSLTPQLAAAEKGKPEVTALTQRSGGPVDPEQAKLQLDTVDLAIEVFPDKETIAGTATLAFTAKAPLIRLLIDLDRNLPVSAIEIDGTPLKPGAWTNPEGRLFVTLPAPIPAGGKVTAKLTYGGTPHVAIRAPWDDGIVWAKTKDGQPWIATTSEGSGCDLFWPCLDMPSGEPERMDLHITVPKGLKAPSNGVLKGVDTLPDGRTTWNWSAKHPNTYAIALNIAPYELIEGDYKSRFGNTIRMQYWYLPGEEAQAKGLFAEFAPTLDFFETLIGPYPFGDEKMGVVETPHLGMEHQTINAYGNGYKKAAEGFDWLFQHEFSHEWFGNQLTAGNWDDYWLHEGYGAYMQPLYGLWREGQARYAAMMAAQRTGIRNKAPIVSGQIRTEEQVYDEDKGGPGGDIYNKGAWMLHTLRDLIGDKAFFEVTTRAVYGRPDPRPGNFKPRFGSTAEYRRIVNEVTGKDYGWFFDVYLSEAALPDLVESRSGDALTLAWKTPGDRPFPMPVEVQIGLDGPVKVVPMTGGSGTLAVPAGEHIIIDPAAKILRRSLAIEAVQAQRQAEAQ
ncbi:M1 family metallopeptidase [Sphingomonas cannabina]|uniref:M1 family metallopeptidase n=1 Tax=Sphingomonas cannabina TaxID=2899123 RepID=UPI001F185090|nr:M1 family metallopeptidase [Sphingomonas cannabina]UIJ44025.1 M1 family metallopeptidase [Sphingomonas cannabina]